MAKAESADAAEACEKKRISLALRSWVVRLKFCGAGRVTVTRESVSVGLYSRWQQKVVTMIHKSEARRPEISSL